MVQYNCQTWSGGSQNCLLSVSGFYQLFLEYHLCNLMSHLTTFLSIYTFVYHTIFNRTPNPPGIGVMFVFSLSVKELINGNLIQVADVTHSLQQPAGKKVQIYVNSYSYWQLLVNCQVLCFSEFGSYFLSVTYEVDSDLYKNNLARQKMARHLNIFYSLKMQAAKGEKTKSFCIENKPNLCF